MRFCCPGADAASGPGGDLPPGGTGADTTAPRIDLGGRRVQRTRLVGHRGLALRVGASEKAVVTLRALVSKRDAGRLGLRGVPVGRYSASLSGPGTRSVRLRPTSRFRRALLRTRSVRIVMRADARDPAGNRSTASLAIRLSRTLP